MIPKVIHYCWFGNNPKPDLYFQCRESWEKYCPDYQIVEWNERNFDVSCCPLYVRQAYEEKKWAFVTDYARLKIIYENGGIYLDTDVELRKKLDGLLDHKAYFGFEDREYINTGLGFGAEQGNQILVDLMDDYADIPFVLESGLYDTTPCPQRNTEVFLKHGLVKNDRKQILGDGILILPSIYLCPLDYNTGKKRKSYKTISVHWYSASWRSKEEKEWHERHKQAIRREKLDQLIHAPNRIVKRFLGIDGYERLKKMCGKKD